MNLCIQEHTKYKTFGVVEMNCDLVLGIDWESNEISFSCCGMNSVIPKLGDTLTLNEFPLENSDSGHSSIQILLVLVEEFFNHNQISLFGMIKFIPDSIEIAVSASGPAFEGSSPVPIPGSLEYIKSKVPEKYHGFINIFVKKESSTLPPHRDQDIKIELEEGKVPPFGPIYSLTPIEKEALHKYLAKNILKGFIQPSTSSTASPILFVKKPNGSLRLCMDYCRLNTITKQNHYPLPLVNELLDAVQGCSLFTKLD